MWLFVYIFALPILGVGIAAFYLLFSAFLDSVAAYRREKEAPVLQKLKRAGGSIASGLEKIFLLAASIIIAFALFMFVAVILD